MDFGNKDMNKRFSPGTAAALRVRALCLAVGLGGSVFATETPAADSQHVKAFKQFVESPPVIKSLKAVIRQGARETFMEIRYQPNGFFVKTATNWNNLLKPYLTPDAEVSGWFDNTYWAISRMNQSLWVEVVSPEVKATLSARITGPNPTPFFQARLAATRLMNLGMDTEELASLRWQGHTLSGTNRAGKSWVGTLKVDTNDVPEMVEESYPDGAWINDSGTSVTRVVYYRYESEIRGWKLPTLIRDEHYDTDFVVLAVQFASKPLSTWEFHYAPFMNGKNPIVMVTQTQAGKVLTEAPFDSLKHGYAKLFAFWLKKSHIRTFFYVFGFVMTAAIGAAIWIHSRDENKTTTPYNRTKNENQSGRK